MPGRVGGLVVRRSIAWLRGDPQATRVARSARRLLGAQGVHLFVPLRLDVVEADVAVEPLPGTPEWLAYSAAELRVAYRVSHPDPLAALALAVTAPRSGFSRLLLGVDPGRLCAASLVGDGILLRAAKMPCSELGGFAVEAYRRMPSEAFEAIVGSGPGFAEAVASLEAEGVPFRLADESWTTSRPAMWDPLRVLGDRDLAAAATIALTLSRARV